MTNVGPEHVLVCGSGSRKLLEIVATEAERAGRLVVIAQVDRELSAAGISEFLVVLKLCDEAGNTMVEGVLDLLLLRGNRSETDQTSAVQCLEILALDDVQEVEAVEAFTVLLEAAAVLSRMAQNCTLAVLEELATLRVLLERI